MPGLPGPVETRRTLNAVVISVLMPALMFQAMRRTALDGAFVLVPLVALGSLLLSFIAALAVYAAWQKITGLKLPKPTLGALVFCAAFGNITFLGLPLLTAYFGDVAPKIVLLHDPFCLGPLVYACGPALGAWFGDGGTSVVRRRWDPLRAVLRMPPFWAVGAGLLAQIWHLPVPAAVDHTLGLMSQAVIPLIVFSVGLALELPATRRHWGGLVVLAPAAALKLFFTPLVTLGLLGFARHIAPHVLTATEHHAVALEGAMPTMVVTAMIAETVGLDHRTAARMVALTTVLSVVTVPWWHGVIAP